MTSTSENSLAPLPESLAEDAEERWRAACEAAEAAGVAVPADRDFVRAVRRAMTFSDFVTGNIKKHPGLLSDLSASGDWEKPGTVRQHLKALAKKTGNDAVGQAGGFSADTLKSSLRKLRRREMTRIAIRDLAGLANLDETLAALSALAEACLEHALSELAADFISRFGAPCGAGGKPLQLVVLAMGKLGAGELNFSSDIDLVFAYPEAGHTSGADKSISNEDFFTRLSRALVAALSEKTADGFVFRVDLGLRPFGESGPIALSFDAMESYYQAHGREWERYALIKARPAAGDKEAGGLLLSRLNPFVYRRYLDYGAFESLRDMKRKITEEVARRQMEGNIKLGAGGIREIEFFGQIFQLIRGGVLPELQKRPIRRILKTLSGEGIIPQEAADELLDAYAFLRRTENAIQEFDDRQTHLLPGSPNGRSRLAAAMGFSSWQPFNECLTGHMKSVRHHFDRLLAGEERSSDKDPGMENLEALWLEASSENADNALKEAGFDDPASVIKRLDVFRSDPSTRNLSPSGRSRLDRLMPKIISAAGTSDNPVSALQRMCDLIQTIQRRTSYLALLLENPTAIDRLVQFCTQSPWIVTYVAQHPVLLDELLDPRNLFSPSSRKSLQEEALRRLSRIDENDLEVRIEALCVFKQVATLRVAAADVSGVLPLMKVSDHLTYIAETVLENVLSVCWTDVVNRYGLPDSIQKNDAKGKGFAIIAYGKLGGLELGYGSDLDLVFLYDTTQGETVGGPRPIDNDQFYARLGQRIIHMLTAHTRAGRLYETDMRLRPSGNSGPLVSRVDAFADYQINSAWTWENQAMVRARPICGDRNLADEFLNIRKQVLSRHREASILRTEVVDMRQRLRNETARPGPGLFDLKQDRGGMVDIEFLVQFLVLLKSHNHESLTRWPDNVRLLIELIKTGVIDSRTAHVLKQVYLAFRAMAHRLSLQEKPAQIPQERFVRHREVVCRIWARILGE